MRLIHIGASINSTFPFTAKPFSIIYINHNLFTVHLLMNTRVASSLGLLDLKQLCRHSLSLRFVLPLTQCKQCPKNHEVFYSDLEGQELYQALCDLSGLSPLFFIQSYFLQPHLVSWHAWINQHLAEDSRRTFCISLEFALSLHLSSLSVFSFCLLASLPLSLFAALSPPVFCHVNSNHTGNPRLPSPSTKLSETVSLCPGLLASCPGDHIKAISGGNYICFLSGLPRWH